MLRARLPILLLGVPLEESENPFLTIPGPVGEAEVEVFECDKPKASLEGPGSGSISSLLNGFVERFSLQAGEKICAKISYRIPQGQSPSSIYAFITTLLTYRIAKYFGETLDNWEIVEAARYADPFEAPSGWGYVLDSMRYSTTTGKVVVYRNDEEFATLTEPLTHNLRYAGNVEVSEQRIKREDVGPDPYNALVHLVGVSVLEAAVRLRDERSLDKIRAIRGLLTSIISYAWDIAPPGEGCGLSPGLPGVFDIYC